MFRLNRMINTFIKLKSDTDYAKHEVLNLIMVLFFGFGQHIHCIYEISGRIAITTFGYMTIQVAYV